MRMRAAVSISLLISLCSCGHIYDFSVPVVDYKSINSVSAAQSTAYGLSTSYQEYQNNIANERQALELPLLASAVFGVSALALGAHPDAAIGAGIVGASAGVLSSYYAPRARSTIYSQAVSAFSCVGGVSSGVAFLDNSSSTANMQAASAGLREVYSLSNTVLINLGTPATIADYEVKQYLLNVMSNAQSTAESTEEALEVARTGVVKITNTITQIQSTILLRIQNSSQTTDAAQFNQNLTKIIEDSNKKISNVQGGTKTMINGQSILTAYGQQSISGKLATAMSNFNETQVKSLLKLDADLGVCAEMVK